jgi:hypothetical protein
MKNEGMLDRWVRVVIGIALLIWAFALGGWLQILVAALAGIALATAGTGLCLLYMPFKIDTSK